MAGLAGLGCPADLTFQVGPCATHQGMRRLMGQCSTVMSSYASNARQQALHSRQRLSAAAAAAYYYCTTSLVAPYLRSQPTNISRYPSSISIKSSRSHPSFQYPLSLPSTTSIQSDITSRAKREGRPTPDRRQTRDHTSGATNRRINSQPEWHLAPADNGRKWHQHQ